MNLLDIELEQLDQIGLLNDQIATLKEKMESMKDVFKNAGEGKYEGNLFNATVFMQQRNTIDYESILQEMGVIIPPALLTKHTKQTVSINMKVSRRKGK
jgi:hypothetical protein